MPAKLTLRRRLLCGVVLLAAMMNVAASPGGPFATSNYAPLVQIFGLPPIADIDVFNRNRSEISLRTDVSSFFAVHVNQREASMVDGDSYRYTLSYSAKPKNGFHWQLAVPYVAYRGGILDGFIDEFHKVFGFPEGGRNLNEKNQQRYFYQRDNKVLFDLRTGQSGIGDVLLTAAWLLPRAKQSNQSRYAWTTSLKLPSGDETVLLGSGSVDASLGLAGTSTNRWGGYDYKLYFSSGLLWLGKSYYLADLQRQFVVFGGAGVNVALNPDLNFKTQLHGHSEFYSGTNISEIGQESLQLSIGGEWQINTRWRFDFAVSEDLLIDAAPDVTFYSALHRAF